MITNLLHDLGFSESVFVANRASVADLFRKKRCGIYVLHCANGEYYVGQAVDVTRRYVQHTKTHSDIERISFLQVSPQDLNAVERRVIECLELNHLPLRNIALTSMPGVAADLDTVVPVDMQEGWLDGQDADWQRQRMIDEELRRHYQKRFRKLHALPCFESQMLPVMRKYVQVALIEPYRTEASFWCCSCLPRFHDPEIAILSRVNIFWQEVFTVSLDRGSDRANFSFHLARSPLGDISLRSWVHSSLLGIPPLDDHRYAPGGIDQCAFWSLDADRAMRVLNDPIVVRAIRLFNLRLMRKGPSANSRSHCMDLADAILP